LPVRNHLIETDIDAVELPPGINRDVLRGRSMLVGKYEVVPIECVARGYLAGSGWREYRQHGTVCGIRLPDGLQQGAQLPEPIFTPATKAETGHDENISLEQMIDRVGAETADALRRKTLDLYVEAAAYARQRGIIIADTKFEWAIDEGVPVLVDEVLTPDSSRFWPVDRYEVGRSPVSFDKQFVRDWLDGTDWDKQTPPPELPEQIVEQTRSKYLEAYERLTGRPLSD